MVQRFDQCVWSIHILYVIHQHGIFNLNDLSRIQSLGVEIWQRPLVGASEVIAAVGKFAFVCS